jgi:hypothetical protein
MRDFGKIQTSIWRSFRSYSDDTKLLAIYLLSSPHTNMIGCFDLPFGYVMADLSMSFERVKQGLNNLSERSFITLDEPNNYILINDFLKFNSIDNPNQAASAINLFDQIPNRSFLKPLLAPVLLDIVEKSESISKDKRGFANTLKTFISNSCLTLVKPLDKPFRNQKQEQKQEQNITPKAPLCINFEHSENPEPEPKSPIQLPEEIGQLKSEELPDEKILALRERSVFDFWKQEFGHSEIVMDSSLRRIIANALCIATIEKCKIAIRGCKIDPWCNGSDPKSNGRVHDSLGMILKNSESIHRYSELWKNRDKIKTLASQAATETSEQRIQRETERKKQEKKSREAEEEEVSRLQKKYPSEFDMVQHHRGFNACILAAKKLELLT